MPRPMIFIMNMRIAHGATRRTGCMFAELGFWWVDSRKAGVSYKLELSECAELDVLDPAWAN